MSAVDRLRGGTHTIDGCRLAYLVEGAGPRVVFVHGGLGRGSAWIGTADLLRDSCSCILLDQRAHGASDWGGGPNVDRAAADLLEVLEAVGPVRAVVGHSYGALVALEAARQGGATRVPGLVLYEPPLTISGPIMDDATVERVERAVAVGDFEDALLLQLASAGGGMSPPEMELLQTDPTLRPVYTDLVIQAPSIAPGVRAANQLDDATPYRAVACPTLLLLGSESPVHPFQTAADALVAAMPDARIASLPGQGHLALLTAPHLVADAIRGFVDA